MTSFDVRVFAIRRRPGRRAFEVRWRVAGQDRSRSFMTRALAACPRTGTAWTSTGTSFEPRGLKHRPDGTIRIAPSGPSWSACSASTYTRSPPRRTGGCSAAATSATRPGPVQPAPPQLLSGAQQLGLVTWVWDANTPSWRLTCDVLSQPNCHVASALAITETSGITEENTAGLSWVHKRSTGIFTSVE